MGVGTAQRSGGVLMRIVRQFNKNWIFSEGFEADAVRQMREGEVVRLPHNAVDLPLNYFDEGIYQREFCYQKILDWEPKFDGREVWLRFDGAMADSVVHLNGSRIAAHTDGYTPFCARLTDRLIRGSNLIAVRISGEENSEIPPFGGQIDYLTYAGIYRDVWLTITGKSWIDTIKVETPDPLMPRKCVRAEFRLGGALPANGTVECRLLDSDGQLIAIRQRCATGSGGEFEFRNLDGIELWDIESPMLYKLELTLTLPDGNGDRLTADFGFRSAEFTPEGFMLNGRPLKIVGLNRHQSFPHVGYAMGRRAQERDAEILKHELNCNLVRTSHYPQSPWFLDHCDRIGLLVFEEIPGWQHLGGEGWKRRAVENVGHMIRRDWNHPSIVLWGVRINESPDDSDLYRQTNSLARQLDSTRQTAGVRNFAASEFLEDVYTMNDFVIGSEELPWINSGRIALRNQEEVTGLGRPVPYLVTEFNGHMHPTKIWDNEQRQMEHVARYLEVLNASFGDRQISGCIGWCMSDYNTHKDFGSGDRICHHGVMDMFRLPKFAAGVYASQVDPSKKVVLQPVTFWARGERSIGGVLPLIVLTNCDEIEMRFGSDFAMTFEPNRTKYPNLPFPPVVIDHLSVSSDSLGAWGSEWDDTVFLGRVAGECVIEVRMAGNPVATEMKLTADCETLLATEKDAIRVDVQALDQVGTPMPFLTDPLTVVVEGPAHLIGPAMLVFRRGTAAFWVESTEMTGAVEISVFSPRFGTSTIEIEAVCE